MNANISDRDWHAQVDGVQRSVRTRLTAQNTGEPWTDCNLRSRPRAHHWAYERKGLSGTWFRCTRCPVATVTNAQSAGPPVPPAPFLR